MSDTPPALSYRILHDNGQEYGPVTAEVVRQWIREARAHARTRIKPEGATEWQFLADLPEFGADLRGPGPLPVAASTGKTSGMAISSLVLGCLGLFTCGVTALIGLILGIVSLVQINKRPNELKGTGLAIAGIVVSALLLFMAPIMAGMLIPALAAAKQKAQAINCVSNLKQLGLAARMYEMDHEVLPGTNWSQVVTQDGFIPGKVLECPGHMAGSCAYAINSAVAGRPFDDVDPSTVLFFESDRGWNASGGKELMITTPRHAGVFNVGFADGSVRQVHPRELPSLRWEP